MKSASPASGRAWLNLLEYWSSGTRVAILTVPLPMPGIGSFPFRNYASQTITRAPAPATELCGCVRTLVDGRADTAQQPLRHRYAVPLQIVQLGLGLGQHRQRVWREVGGGNLCDQSTNRDPIAVLVPIHD